ncbi:MAG: preprotein translocase subunit SecD, partial [Ilumatobacteraceae bacterium]
MRKKLLYSLIGILILAFGGLIITLVDGDTPSLGLDLQGGISITQKPVGPFNVSSLDLAVERIRARVDSLGVAEPEILRQGDAIVVNLPGVKNQAQAEALVKVTGQVYLRPVLTDAQLNIPCVTSAPSNTPTTTSTTPTGTTIATSNPGSTVAGSTTVASGTNAPTTTLAGGPSRLPGTANTSTTVAAPTTSTTVPTGTPTTTVPGGTTTTTVAGSESTLPDVPPDQTGYVKARGGSFCYVGPAGGTGEVFQDDATARILSGSGWGVTVSLRGGANGVDKWNVLASECYNATALCPTRQLAIVLDGEVISAPTVQQP